MNEKKITLATVKSFIRKNRADLQIYVKSRFDGMVDGIEQTGQDSFRPALDADNVTNNNLGIQGIWVVGSTGNYFTKTIEGDLEVIECYNCCGTWKIAA